MHRDAADAAAALDDQHALVQLGGLDRAPAARGPRLPMTIRVVVVLHQSPASPTFCRRPDNRRRGVNSGFVAGFLRTWLAPNQRHLRGVRAGGGQDYRSSPPGQSVRRHVHLGIRPRPAGLHAQPRERRPASCAGRRSRRSRAEQRRAALRPACIARRPNGRGRSPRPGRGATLARVPVDGVGRFPRATPRASAMSIAACGSAPGRSSWSGPDVSQEPCVAGRDRRGPSGAGRRLARASIRDLAALHRRRRRRPRPCRSPGPWP